MCLGLGLAKLGTRAALASIPEGMPRANDIGLDVTVLLFSFLISVVAGIIFGLAPAWKATRGAVGKSLSESGRGLAGKRGGAQALFVIGEMAMALVLLVGAGLMIRTLFQLWGLDPGFNPQKVTSFELSGPDSYTKQPAATIRAAYRQVHDKLASAPGVEAVSLNWGATPMGSDDEEYFWYPDRPKPAHLSDLPMTLLYVAEPDYLRVMQIPLKRGRFFTPADNEHSAAVAVIDESFAEKFFPGSDPIGKYLDMNTNPADPDKVPNPQIIGVVGHVNQWGLDSDATSPLHAQLYLPFAQASDKDLQMRGLSGGVFFRHKAQGAADLATIRNRIHEFNSELVIHNPEDMTKTVADSIEDKRFTMALLGVFALLALLLASIGIYGVLSYMVGQRTREIGVRMALGAQRVDVLSMVLRDGARMTVIGIGVGIAAAIGLTRLMASMLFGVKPFDPATFVSVSLLLSLVALFACYMPARKAMKVDPMEALRQQ